MQTLQNLVDSLSRRLHCAVALDERPFNMMFHSCMYGRLDEARIRRMLAPDRGPEPEVRRYVQDWVYREPPVTSPVRIPANPRLGIESRLFMPLRHGDERLGSILIFDPEYAVQEEDMGAIVRAAEVALQIIRYERIVWDPERGREHDLQAAILFGDRETRERAAIEIRRTGMLPGGPCTVLVASPVRASNDASSTPVLAEAAEDMRSLLAAGYALLTEAEGEVLLLVSMDEPAIARDGIMATARRLQKATSQALKFGIGGAKPDLQRAHESLEEARRASSIAGGGPFGTLVAWPELGALRLLLQMPAESLSHVDLVPGMEKLVATQPVLCETLGAFLENAGHSQQTAAQLFIHRATLHYRLKRLEELTGRSLNSGEDRLALHLALKIALLNRLREQQELPSAG